jgi:hypothetical protein
MFKNFRQEWITVMGCHETQNVSPDVGSFLSFIAPRREVGGPGVIRLGSFMTTVLLVLAMCLSHGSKNSYRNSLCAEHV